MNLRSLDLNLLVILDALLDEAHVSRAAERLFLSQPATSAALQRCRHLFRDPLLERGRGSMRLTPKAQSLRMPLKSLLSDVLNLVELPEVPLSDIKQTLRITMADYPALLVIALLQRALGETAPGIAIVVQPWRGGEAARVALIDGTTDIAISVFPGKDADIHCEWLLDENYVIALRHEHPAIPGFDLARWLSYPHILVSGRGEANSPLDDELAQLALSRRIGLVVPSFGMVPDLLRGSDMIAMLPSRVLSAAGDLSVLAPPIPVNGFRLHLAWHQRREKDKALRHVTGLLKDLLK
jgi:DNA-binding transcriptional LysR family regulator